MVTVNRQLRLVQSSLLVDISCYGSVLKISVAERSFYSHNTLATCHSHSIDFERLHQLNREIVDLLNRANRYGSIDHSNFDLLRRAGQRLYDELLPHAVKKEIGTTQCENLVLTIDDSLVYLPWELLYTGESFLCLKFCIGRLVRTSQSLMGSPRPLGKRPYSLLVLCDPKSDLLASYYEGVSIRDNFDYLRNSLTINLKSTEIDNEYVKNTLRDYDMVHYAGHADFDPASPHQSGWRLSDGRFTMQDILQISGGHSFPRLMFVNACRSGHIPPFTVGENNCVELYGLANAFLLSGVQHYIGTLWDIPDESSCHFALKFYRRLLQGDTIGRAIRSARQYFTKRYGSDTILWASYILYGDPSMIYFPRIVKQSLVDSSHTTAPSRVIREPQAITVQEGGATIHELAGRTPRTTGASAQKIRGTATYTLAPITPLASAERTWSITLTILPLFITIVVGVFLAFILFGENSSDSIPSRMVFGQQAQQPHPYINTTSITGDLEHEVLEETTFPITLEVQAKVDFHQIKVNETTKLASKDKFQIRVSSDTNVNLYVVQLNSQGEITPLYPGNNKAAIWHLAGRQHLTLPGKKQWYRINAVSGFETIIAWISHTSHEDFDRHIESLSGITQAYLTSQGSNFADIHLRHPTNYYELIDHMTSYLKTRTEAIDVITFMHE